MQLAALTVLSFAVLAFTLYAKSTGVLTGLLLGMLGISKAMWHAHTQLLGQPDRH